MTKLMTTKFPLLAFVAELAVQMESGGWDLELAWVPRDQNQEADAITNDLVDQLDPARRISTAGFEEKFLVLRKMLDLGDTFYQEKEAQRSAALARRMALEANGLAPPARVVQKKRKAAGIKVTQPW